MKKKKKTLNRGDLMIGNDCIQKKKNDREW